MEGYIKSNGLRVVLKGLSHGEHQLVDFTAEKKREMSVSQHDNR